MHFCPNPNQRSRTVVPGVNYTARTDDLGRIRTCKNGSQMAPIGRTEAKMAKDPMPCPLGHGVNTEKSNDQKGPGPR